MKESKRYERADMIGNVIYVAQEEKDIRRMKALPDYILFVRKKPIYKTSRLTT